MQKTNDAKALRSNLSEIQCDMEMAIDNLTAIQVAVSDGNLIGITCGNALFCVCNLLRQHVEMFGILLNEDKSENAEAE